jgi:aspartate/methionine/tyrosine aminotransferase
MITLPGMRERTARIGSAGKTFSITGWKVGYIVAPPAMLRPITKAHQFVTFTTPPNLQHAVALGLGQDDGYFVGVAAAMVRSRDRLATGLVALGVPVLPCDGTYFLVADVSRWLRDGEDDVAFCRRLVVEAGVVLIPMSAFYERAAPRGLVRFCFCKLDATIDAALDRLAAWSARGGGGPAR